MDSGIDKSDALPTGQRRLQTHFSSVDTFMTAIENMTYASLAFSTCVPMP